MVSGSIEDESVPIEETEFYRRMEANRPGNLLAGSRLKEGLTQKKLAALSGIPQSVISEYESGSRAITKAAATKLAKVLGVQPEYFC